MNLGQLIENELRAMQNRPARVVPAERPDVPVGPVLERLIAAELPQTMRNFQATQAAKAKAAQQQEAAENKALARGFSGEFEYEQGVPNF